MSVVRYHMPLHFYDRLMKRPLHRIDIDLFRRCQRNLKDGSPRPFTADLPRSAKIAIKRKSPLSDVRAALCQWNNLGKSDLAVCIKSANAEMKKLPTHMHPMARALIMPAYNAYRSM